MANEEHRGESQSQLPNIIGPTVGLRPPAVVAGMRGFSSIPDTTPNNAPRGAGNSSTNQAQSLPQRVFSTLPLNGKRFSYDYYINILFGVNTTDFATTNIPFQFSVPLIGEGAFITPSGPGSMLVSNTKTFYPAYQGYTTLVSELSFSIFWANSYVGGLPARLNSFILTPQNTYISGAPGARLELSGQSLSEYLFNTVGAADEKLFIAMNQTDTLNFYWNDYYTSHFVDPAIGSPIIYPSFYMWFKCSLKGILIPDSGLPKDWQVSI